MIMKINAELNKVYRTPAPVFANVYSCVNEYNRGYIISTKGERLGRSVEVTTLKMNHKIIDAISTLQGTEFCILHEKLFSTKKKRNRVIDLKTVLTPFRCNLDEFLRQHNCGWNIDPLLFTSDEAGVSMVANIMSAGKVMNTVFEKRNNNNWTILCVVITLVGQKKEKKSSF